jgi:hypothetical protein
VSVVAKEAPKVAAVDYGRQKSLLNGAQLPAEKLPALAAYLFEIHGQHASDGVQLPALVETTAQQFTLGDVTADLAYSSHDNLINVALCGGNAVIPFKHNASHGQGGMWSKMLAYFHIHREEFLKRYHQRSNVESTFSMIKRKFGDSVRSKLDVAMKNEVLAKLVCHNICCVNQEAHELGIDPGFGGLAETVLTA